VTERFALGGAEHEIDLSAKNAAAFREQSGTRAALRIRFPCGGVVL
jgi:hypothetical protein